MRTFILFGLVAMLTSTTAAQPPQRGMPQISPLMLLSNKDVQKELKLSEEQNKKVTQEMNFQRVARQGLRELEDEKERNQKADELNQRGEKLIADVLKPDQAKRLKQIALQVDGAQSFGKTAVADELKLTAEQRRQIKQIQEDTLKQVRTILEPGGNREEAMKKRGEIVARSKEQLMALLTAEQKAQWKVMTGAPFQGDLRFGGGRSETGQPGQRPPS